MVAIIRVVGANHLRALGKDLKAMGEEGKGFRRELLASMRLAGKPLPEQVRASAREVLPKKGGLNEYIATSSITTRNSLSGRRAGVRVVARKKGGSHGFHDIEAFEIGTFRHPVHGHKKTWVPQTITGGFFTKSMDKTQGKVKFELLKAMEVTEYKISKG